MGNNIGKVFKLTSFGESHGAAIGGVIDGCPAGVFIDLDFIKSEIRRRKPLYKGGTPRKEEDDLEILSGVFEGKTTGTPIAFLVRNQNTQSKDYDELKDVYRPSHADFTYDMKYGHRDHRGGGRSSARETVTRVIGGAIAKLFLKQIGVEIFAYVSQIGKITLIKEYSEINSKEIENFEFRFPDKSKTKAIADYIDRISNEGDSVGGMVTAVIKNCPIGLGEPVFDKLQADLAKAMLSINAVKGFEYGQGFESASLKGSENNDEFISDNNGNISTLTNKAGGILGGISNGEDIYFNVAFKPVASISLKQNTVTKSGETVELEIKGRHDAVVVPRAVVVVEAMAALTIADHFLRNKTSRT